MGLIMTIFMFFALVGVYFVGALVWIVEAAILEQKRDSDKRACVCKKD